MTRGRSSDVRPVDEADLVPPPLSRHVYPFIAACRRKCATHHFSGVRIRSLIGAGSHMMEYRQLGASGLKVPVLKFGTGAFGGVGELFKAWGHSDTAEATRLVDVCLEAGLTMFDSADVYSDGMAEEILGQAIKGRRDEVLLATKGTFRTGPRANDVGSSRHHLVRAVDASLRRLDTEHIDLYQLHAFDAMTPVDEVLSALDDLVRSARSATSGAPISQVGI